MTKRALCVGINAYPNAPLYGCVNDATDWMAHLASQGYGVALLHDEAATKIAITSALAHMVADSRWGDRIVFTYSGHGSWIPDRNGDEEDGRDEVLCAVDYEADGLISDDELASIFSMRRRGVRVTVISDSCHSGSVNRVVDVYQRFQKIPRYISPLTFLHGAEFDRAAEVMTLPSKTAPRPSSTVLFSGCADAEVSYDASFNGRPGGAFTTAAIQALEENPSASYGRLWKEIRRSLPNVNYPQTPELYATAWQRTWRL